MYRSDMRNAICAIVLAAAGGPVVAAELSALATLAAQGPLLALEQRYQQQGQTVTVRFDTSPNITKRLAAGERPDVLIAQASTVDRMVEEGRAVAATRATLGRIGVGVAMGRGSRRPDIATVDALEASLLQADAVVYSQGASGLLVERMLRDMGIAETIAAKVVQLPTGGDVMQRMGTEQGNQIGFTMISEIKLGESHGGALVGPLPAAVQTYTTYDAVVMVGAAAPEASAAFVRALTTPDARRVFTAAGWEY
jgi:molybdate transport system substrate-binding protein